MHPRPSAGAAIFRTTTPEGGNVAARRAKAARDPFEVDLSEEQESELCLWLCREIDAAEDARSSIVGNDGVIDRSHEMYEGGNARLVKNTPWPGAANLGSPIVTEKVDALRARIVATIFTDPIWIVDGWGDSAEKAPFVESLMQYKAESGKLQSYVGRVVHNSLIEGTGVLEVSDRVVLRKGVRKIKAVLQRDPATGRIALDETGSPVPLRNQQQKFIEAQGDEPFLEMFISDVVRATAGPSFRVLSLKNFFVLPGHASEREDIRAYAKRFWRALPELQCRERDGYYKNIEALGLAGEKDQTSQQLRAGQDIAHQYDKSAEKEIWEVLLLDDLDDDGYEEWYVVTLSRLHRKILRIQYQDYGTPHYVLFTPFPRPDSVYGYSLAWDKLGSLYDEHAALRNMFADRSTLATSAPFLQVAGSPWNASLKPFGPREVIPVRDLNELKQLEVRDVPNSVFQNLQMVLQLAERMSGMNDLTLGVQASSDRTLGENRIATEQSFIRIDEIVRNFQEGLEDLFGLLMIIWKNKLTDSPELMPSDLLASMTERGIDIPPGRVTADMLTGTFRGKPRGSVESADLGRMRNDFVAMMTSLTQMAQSVPALAQHLSSPRVIRSILTQVTRMFRWADREGLLAGFTGMAAPPQQPMPGQQPGQPGPGAPGPQLPNPNMSAVGAGNTPGGGLAAV